MDDIIKYFVDFQKEDASQMITCVGYEEIPAHTSYPSKKHKTGYYFDPEKGRVLNEYQLVYVTNGEGMLETEHGGEFKIKTGMVFVLFPGEWHTYRPNEDLGWSHYWIGITNQNMSRWLENSNLKIDNPVFNVGINGEILSLFQKALRIAEEEQSMYQNIINGLTNYIVALLGSVNDCQFVERCNYVDNINQACMIMSNEESVDSIADLARNVGMGYSLFRREFKRQKGCSPIKYLQSQKISQAERLLVNTNLSLKEITFRLSFGSPSYFSSQFKKIVGVSPTQYRNERTRSGR